MTTSAEPEAQSAAKMKVAIAGSVGMICAALLLPLRHAYPSIVNYWDRKTFEVTVEKTLAQRGIATAEDHPKTSIHEYGVGGFKGRELPAIVVKVDFLQVDKAAGEKAQRCLFVYALYDKEFETYRSMSLSECNKVAELDSWKKLVKYR